MKKSNEREKEFYEQKIIKMMERIKDPVILMKIYTFVKTHSEIIKEKE